MLEISVLLILTFSNEFECTLTNTNELRRNNQIFQEEEWKHFVGMFHSIFGKRRCSIKIGNDFQSVKNSEQQNPILFHGYCFNLLYLISYFFPKLIYLDSINTFQPTTEKINVLTITITNLSLYRYRFINRILCHAMPCHHLLIACMHIYTR